MGTAHWNHTATLLPNGQVLVTGGNFEGPGSAELYDPTTGTWTRTNSIHPSRSFHTATLLPNGNVLVPGGSSRYGILSLAQLYKTASTPRLRPTPFSRP